MSAKPHSCSTMEPILVEPSVCLICFEMTEKHISLLSDVPEKLFINCNKYLHSTLTKGTLKDIKLHNENQVPLCKRCFDSALELTQLSEQLTTIQKDISDLTVGFSMAVFHRRSQVYSIGQSCATSSIVEFNEACLPPNLFSMKLGDQNIHPKKNNQEIDINSLHLQTDIPNVKCEGSDIQLDNLQQSNANDDIKIHFNKDHVDKQCEQPTIEENQNLVSVSEMRIVHVSGRNDSKKCADTKTLTLSALLKSVKMPKIILKRTKIVGQKLDSSVENSNQTKCESRQKIVAETLFKDDDVSLSCAPESPGDGNVLKCLYCEKTFTQECHRTLHHKTHTGVKNKRPRGKQKFYRSNQKICQITPTGRKTFYKCSYCEKMLSGPYKLKIHERTHTGEKPFKCSFCKYRCNDSFSLKRHERIHTGQLPFQCSFCNKRFNQCNDLKHHERTHTGEKPFKCSFCGQSFSKNGNMKAHERLHTGEKPYKCLYCEKTFSGSRAKKSHQKCHTEQLEYLVGQFGNQKDGSLLGDLKQEEQMHMEFKCSFCEMTFSHDEERANHENIHRREDEIVNENFIVGI